MFLQEMGHVFRQVYEQAFAKLQMVPYASTSEMAGRMKEHYARSSLNCFPLQETTRPRFGMLGGHVKPHFEGRLV